MRRPELLATLWLGACSPTAPAADPVPLPAGPGPRCLPPEIWWGGACVPPQTREVVVGEDLTVRLEFRDVDGRGWWFGSEWVSQRAAMQACAAIGASPFLPANRRDVAVGVHFAMLSAQVQQIAETPRVWVAMEVDVGEGVVKDIEGRPLFSWRKAAPPLPGNDDYSQEAFLQEAIDAAANGGSSESSFTCFALAPDGAVRVGRCSLGKATLCAAE